MRRALIVFALTAALGCKRHHRAPVRANAADADRDKAAASSRAFSIVRSLTDEVGPRMSGTEGDARAVGWALAKMRELGLENVRSEPVTVPHWERGAASATLLNPRHELQLAALGGSVGTPEGGLEADVVAVASIEALGALPQESVAGKIVFFDKPMTASRDGAGYGRAVDVRGKGAVAAARRGAVAVLIRSVGTGPARMPHTGGMRYADDAPKIPAAALAISDAELLRRTVARTGAARIRLNLGCRPLPDATSANVLGEVVGEERRADIVLIGAHLDSWDLGDGAVDDGAGVAIVLETARRLRERPRRPRRTLRVALFANEESGLRGAIEYARVHREELPRHVIALEADLGAGRVFAMSFLSDPRVAPAIIKLGAPLAALGVSPPTPGDRHGADLWPLRNAGVPVVELHQDATRYFDLHHTADDTLDKIDPIDLDQATAATALFTFGAVDSDADLGRIPEDKRK